MLKGIDPLIGAELLHVLASMGHGDELVLADQNYPAYSTNERVLRADGVDSVTLGRAILSLMPLDSFVKTPLACMAVDDDPSSVPPVRSEFVAMAEHMDGRSLGVELVERRAFYERARGAFAVVATGEWRSYGCFILTKGVLPGVRTGVAS